MKTPLLQTTVLLLFLVGGVCAQSLPRDAQELLKKQQAAISRLNETLNNELEKVKARCMRDGDLEGANAVAAIIKNPESAPVAFPRVDASSVISIIGEYTYTYLSNGYQESWSFRDKGRVDFRPKGDSGGGQEGRWKVSNGILIVEKPPLTFHFPINLFVSSKIEGIKGSATIKKNKE